jgi:hypothetical protein
MEQYRMAMARDRGYLLLLGVELLGEVARLIH